MSLCFSSVAGAVALEHTWMNFLFEMLIMFFFVSKYVIMQQKVYNMYLLTICNRIQELNSIHVLSRK